MPYRQEYVPAEVFLEYKGVKIYHVYKNNDVDCLARIYWFDDQEDSDDDGGFDIRALAKNLGDVSLNPETVEGRRVILRAAIDAGLIEAGDELEEEGDQTS